MSETICPLPWLHLSVNTDTAIRVCCNTDHSGRVVAENGQPIFLSQIKSIDEYFNNRFMKSLRKDMMQGKKPEFCRKCYSIEDNGGSSIRETYVAQFRNEMLSILPTTDEEGHVPPDIRYIDFSLGNLCNLKCRMCGPGSSYILKKEFDRLGIEYDSDYAARAHTGWNQSIPLDKLLAPHIGNLEEMLTTGGEPCLSKLHRDLLKRLVALGRSQDIILRYHSNLTVVPQELIELWAQFKRIDLHVSIEGVGRVNDYIRYSSSWDTFTVNLNKLIELSSTVPIQFEFHTCFQTYNFLEITELLQFTGSFREKIPAMPHFIWLDNPIALSAHALPAEVKKVGTDRIEEYLDQNCHIFLEGPFASFNQERISLLRSYLRTLNDREEDSSLWKKFKDYANLLDQDRTLKIDTALPELFCYF